MLGGGIFTSQNKILPGAYLNFVSASRASAKMSERGIAALGLELDWGPEKEVFTVEATEFEKESRSVFGYMYYEKELKGIRDLFCHAKTAMLYRLNGGEKASNTYGTARYSGTRGNDLITVVQTNIDDTSRYDVITLLESSKVDMQTVGTASELLDNDFVIFKKNAQLAVTAGEGMAGGTNGSGVTGEDYQVFLNKVEGLSFHALGCLSADKVIKSLFVAFTRRMRDEMGIKFQTVICDGQADHEGVINVKNTVMDTDSKGTELVYWLAGATAGCEVNRTLTNALYDGEYNISTDFKQMELENFIKSGFFLFHKVGTEVRVLSDINSLTSLSDEKNSDFVENQVIRVLDQIGNDIAATFNTRYLGKVQNDAAGRTGLWNDITAYCRQLESIRALENFAGDDVTVEKGNDKKSVTVSCAVMPVCSMTKLYMTVTVR